MNSKFYGYIYKITHPEQFRSNGKPHIYIGRTIKSLEERLSEHKNAAKKKKINKKNRLGKLHALMKAYGPENFQIAELAIAQTREELNKLEKSFVREYDALNSWNSITPSKSSFSTNKSPIIVNIYGQEYKGTLPEICRKIDISQTTVIHWLKKQFSYQEAIEKGIKAKDITKSREIIIFNTKVKNLSDACRDRIINKNKLPIKLIQYRVRQGMTPEEAFKKPLSESHFKSYELKLPNDNIIHAKTIRGIIKKFELAGFTSPPESTVVSRLAKGENIETAFELTPRPWLQKKLKEIKSFIVKGYQIIGDLKHEGSPIVIHSTKKIYPTTKEFSKAYNFPFDTVLDKLKEGKSADDIIKFYENRRKKYKS